METYNEYKLYTLIQDIIKIIKEQGLDSDKPSLQNRLISCSEKVQTIALKLDLKIITEEIIHIKLYLDTDESIIINIDKIMEHFTYCSIILEKLIFQRRIIAIISNNPGEFGDFAKDMGKENFHTVIESDSSLQNIINIVPELIILNVENVLPVLNTFKHEDITRKIPIIVIGESSSSFKMDILKNGAIAYLPSPFDSDELFFMVKNIYTLLNMNNESRFSTEFTGIYIKEHGKILADNYIRLCSIKNLCFNFMIIGIDNMSPVNLEIFEEKSNSIISDIADIINSNINGEDYAFRIHDDELGIIFIDKTINEIQKIYDKMLQKVNLLCDKFDTNINLSSGISTLSNELNEFSKIYKSAYINYKELKCRDNNKVLFQLNNRKNNIPKLLILSNDKIILSILSTRYKNEGYEVQTFENGKKALETIRNDSIDLVITDYYMELMSCDEVIRNIRSFNKEIKIIVLSGQKSEDFVRIALELGADDYIKKPFSPIELDIRIEKLLKQW